MNRQEYAQLTAVRRSLWEQAKPMTREDHEAAFSLLAGVDFAAARSALMRLALEGREWPPPMGVLVAEAAGGDDATTSWAEARELLCRAASRFGREREHDALVWLDEQSSTAARMAVEVGWRQWCREELDSPTHGGAVNARLESLYSTVAASERLARAEGQQLDVVGRRLRLLGAGDERGGLHRPNFGELVA